MGKFENRLKELREKAGYSQQELAERLQVSRSRIGMYEQGKRKPDPEMQELIADFFNVNLAGDITGECRHLTKTMWNNMEEFFHETIWNRKDLWERFDFALDESKHDWCREQTISCYSDTDSLASNSDIFGHKALCTLIPLPLLI